MSVIARYYSYLGNRQGRAQLRKALQDGTVMVHPSDTCYGLACSVLHHGAIERIYSIKQRELSKPSSILVSDIPMLLRVAAPSKKALECIATYGAERVTYLLPLRDHTLHGSLHQHGTISVRIPKQLVLRRMIQSLGHPILTTSANLKGAPESYTEGEVYSFLSTITEPVPITLLAGSLQKIAPSTIIDMRGDHPTIIRQGSFTLPS